VRGAWSSESSEDVSTNRWALVVTVAAVALAGCGEADGDADRNAADVTRSTSEPTATSASEPTATTALADIHRAATCESVPFTSNSEDIASDVKAFGISCDEAEAFVRKAGARTSSGGPADLDVDGYRCVRTRTEEDPLPRSFYECSSGSKRVSFVRS